MPKGDREPRDPFWGWGASDRRAQRVRDRAEEDADYQRRWREDAAREEDSATTGADAPRAGE